MSLGSKPRNVLLTSIFILLLTSLFPRQRCLVAKWKTKISRAALATADVSASLVQVIASRSDLGDLQEIRTKGLASKWRCLPVSCH